MNCTMLPIELVDMDRHAHAHTRHNGFATGGVERDHDRDALPNFGEIAARVVLGWQQRELTGGRHDDALYLAGETGTAVGIDVDIDTLADLHVINGTLVHVGGHID